MPRLEALKERYRDAPIDSRPSLEQLRQDYLAGLLELTGLSSRLEQALDEAAAQNGQRIVWTDGSAP